MTPSQSLTFHIVGDAYVDIFCFLEGDLPDTGGDSRLEQPIRQYAGGSATNTATHLHSLTHHFAPTNSNGGPPDNARTVMLHTVLNEEDDFGKFLLAHVQRHGFPLHNCNTTEDISTGHCVAIVSRGERSFMTHQGCVGSFTAQQLDLPQMISTHHHAHIHVAGFYNIDGFHNGSLQQALEQIRLQRSNDNSSSGKTTTMSLVTQHDATGVWDGGLQQVAPFLDFLIMNELEANSIIKSAGSGAASQEEEIQAWKEYFSNEWDPTTCVIVTLGERGAVAFRNHQIMAQLKPALSVDVVDPTGAGDSFTAGFLHGLWSWQQNQQEQGTLSSTMTTRTSTVTFEKLDWSKEAIQEALFWGCAVGTSAVTIRGASNPATPEQIQSFYDRQTK
mmetsp:Transcript_283/g.830  ORF Transcript_283/g.830 Transcript_283/m.830 type:complete len:389 (+) Transcript_283:94-1260(+)|eukprot:CAMPEP_0168746320 /NCGR_PEP_ID=MMETSP0724-20121128/15084_1 /TAXON_ID=265536 /ORGANISM="Amphiprora sp., Strain CCMP467" /LENGTH=388 /DNA_ID=CAMNT_0008794083 /DNA_START=52 /DNA_END=1218 /DNA_ORIENTATION=-